MSIEKRNVLKLAKTIYDEYCDLSNRFEIGCITKKTSCILIDNVNFSFVETGLCKKLSDTQYIYNNEKDLIRDVLLYNYENWDEIDVDELVKKLNELKVDDEMIMLHYNMDFCDIRVFRNEADIETYKNEFCDFED